jgi:dihydroorotase
VEALKEGLANGTIECISTDHAPHSEEEKSQGFRRSPFGIVGLETSAALTYTELVKGGVLTLMQMAEKMSRNPARILGVPGGSLKEGMPADIAVFDFEHPWRIDPRQFVSRGRNTPFIGREVYGAAVYTISGGQIVYRIRP